MPFLQIKRKKKRASNYKNKPQKFVQIAQIQENNVPKNPSDRDHKKDQRL